MLIIKLNQIRLILYKYMIAILINKYFFKKSVDKKNNSVYSTNIDTNVIIQIKERVNEKGKTII